MSGHGLPPKPSSSSGAGPSRSDRQQSSSRQASHHSASTLAQQQPSYGTYPTYHTTQSGGYPYMPQAPILPWSNGVSAQMQMPHVNPYYAQAYSSYYAAALGQSQPQTGYNANGYTYSQTYTPGSNTQGNQGLQGSDTQPPAKKAKYEVDTTYTHGQGGGANGASWRNCSQKGCKFVGSAENVRIHEEDRHLIFANGNQVERSEEEERYAKHKGPAPAIPGTNITLHTEEDIAKWIADRKAKWPSAKRVQEKDEERKAAIARGEFVGRGRGGRGRGRGGMRVDPAALAEDWGRPVQEMQEGQSGGHGGRGRHERGRGRGRGGNERDRGRGRGRGRGGRHTGDEGHRDNGYQNVSSQMPPPPQSVETATLINQVESEKIQKPQNPIGLAALGEYESSSAGSDSSNEDSDSESDSSSDTSSEDSNDSDIDVEKGNPKTKNTDMEELKPREDTRPICRFFAKSGKCKFGDKCKFSHVKSEKSPQQEQQQEQKKRVKQPPNKRVNPFDRPSMLGALLATPIQNTISQLSQTIRFLVANDMLRNVELRPGQAEEQEEERNKVVLVGDDEGVEVEGESPGVEGGGIDMEKVAQAADS